MWNKLLSDVRNIITMNAGNVPAGYEFWKKQKTLESISVDEYFQVLQGIFKEEEKVIEMKRGKPYVSDDYENGVRSFAIALTMRLMEDFINLKERTSYMELLGQMHMAYAFYHLLNEKEHGQYVYAANDTKYMKYLYQGLMKFYSAFYERFDDNEEAICLLCKYYPKGEHLWIRQEEAVNILYSHIKNAGTFTDLGYAFRGIEQIQKYIHGLPNEVITQLLNQYRLYDVLNQPVYRHQVLAVIEGSELTKKEKRALKFLYLDSLLLANIFNSEWVEKKREQNRKIEIHYNFYDKKLDKNQIHVLKNPEAFWVCQDADKRIFMVNGEREAWIYVYKDTIEFYTRKRMIKFLFDYSDWALEGFRRKETRERIKSLVFDGAEGKIEKGPMVFSFVYLDNYRGMDHRTLDLDHRFTFDPGGRVLKRQKEGRDTKLHFYGKSVYSLSCIVGKNGTGKTSIVDFMRDTFYKIVRVMDDFGIPCKEGCVDLKDFDKYMVINEEITFLVVFRFGKEDYYLTNIAGISSTGAHPYQLGICCNIDNCKVAYFSQQLRTDYTIFFENRIERENASGILRTLDGLGQCDYSEMKSFVLRKRVIEDLKKSEVTGMLNRELCYQFSLLRNVGIEKLCKYMDTLPKSKFVIYSLKSGEAFERFDLRDCHNSSRIKELEEKYVKMPDAAIGFFSSGQYAKFMFLAKIYWFLEGYHKDAAHYNQICNGEKGRLFPMEDALQQGETALVFIDEGEVYYHPEWQRRYLSTLLDMLCVVKEKAKIQIILTANSPFVISDVMKEDVQYLSDKKEEFENTLGQNIHKLLKKNFFMDYTIGEYSRKLLETIIFQLTNEKNTKSEDSADIYHYFDDTQDKYRMIGFLIQQIGEPIYRDKLEKMLLRRMESREETKEIRIRELERQKEDLEKELAKLRGEEE